METSRVRMRAGILFLYLTLVVISLTHCDADRSMKLMRGPKLRRDIISKNPKKLTMIKHFNLPSLFSTNAQPYSVSSPLNMPPYESLAPNPLPENNPPYCENPPPGTPSTTIPTPMGSQPSTPSPIFPTQSPPLSPNTIIPGPPGSLPTPTPEIDVSPPSTIIPNPPIIEPGPPESSLSPPSTITPNPPIIEPGSPESSMSPPYYEPSPPSTITPNPPIIEPGPPESSMSPPYFEPSPPFYIPSPTGGIIPGPPTNVPSPTGGGIVPSPTVFQPPIVYPPPSVPPPPRSVAPSTTLWCVAKPSVPDPIIQEAMNYACASGADCDSISPNGPCFEPNSLYAHASYAFNSYWQKNKAAGTTCDLGGTAILVALDPSFDGCRFIYN